MNFSEGAPHTETTSVSEEVQAQLANLGLSPEQVRGDVLDVGADDAEFARGFAGKEGVKVTSLDEFVPEGLEDTVIQGRAENLPFGDCSFDLLVAHASVPNTFLGTFDAAAPKESQETMERSIDRVFGEALRVLRRGGEARFSPIRLAEDYPPQQALKAAVLASIGKLQSHTDLEVNFALIGTRGNPENGEETQEWRSVIRKLVPAAA